MTKLVHGCYVPKEMPHITCTPRSLGKGFVVDIARQRNAWQEEVGVLVLAIGNCFFSSASES